jgi:hypothetical protein
LFGSWIAEVVGERREIVVAMYPSGEDRLALNGTGIDAAQLNRPYERS